MRKLAVLLLLLVLTFVGLSIPVQVANAQDVAACAYVFPNGSFTQPFFAEGWDCAAFIYDVMAEAGFAEGWGVWGFNEMYVNFDGDVWLNGVYEGGLFNTEPASVPQAPPANTQTEWDIRELLILVDADINDFWTQEFAAAGLVYREPLVILENYTTLRTPCGLINAGMGPLYCPGNNTIYLPTAFMQWSLDNVGDFAAAVILAHEWGHSVSAQLGFMQAATFNGNTGAYAVNIEIQADCYAGAYAGYAATRSSRVLLEDGDLEEGWDQMFMVGRGNNPMDIWLNPRAHGSSEQRTDAFMMGLESGASVC